MSASVHEHPEEWLAAALADGLAPNERRALNEHLAVCERCRALQADLAALDETLLRDFPLAVGPEDGFEARLVANFRQRQGKGWRLEKLCALAAWLLRQRGVRFAGVAAGLLGMIWLGQFLTGSDPLSLNLASTDIVTPQIQIQLPQTKLQLSQSKSVDGTAGEFEISRPPTDVPSPSKIDVSRLQYQLGDVVISNPSRVLAANDKSGQFLGSVPVGDINVGRDVTAGFGEVQIPIIGPDAHIPKGYAVTEQSAWANASDAGLPTFEGKSRLTLLDGRRVADASTASRDFDDSIYNGTLKQATGTDAPGGNPSPSSTPAPVSPSQNVSTPVPTDTLATTPAPPDVRKLIRNARAELEVASFDAAVDAVTANAARDGGFLDTRNSARGGNGKIAGSLVVKVLPENLDRFLASLRALGDVKNQTVQTEDVTKDYFDTDARLRNSRRMEERLLKMLDEVKGKMSEVLQVEKELARVRAEIETMQGQLKMYDALVRYATVTLDVRERDLNQPAAFLLRETATLSLLAADVEKTAAEVRRIADAAHAQTVRSEITRDPSGKSRATLRLLIAPEASADVLGQIKTLGRVENFHVQDERTAQNGAPADAAAQDPAKVERAPVTLDLTISHDEQISRQVTLTLVAADVEGAFEKARAASVAAGGEVVESSVTRPSAGHANAVLGVRVPASSSSSLLASFQSLGRAGEAETRRVGNGAEADAGPVLIRLSVVDAEPAVQQTNVRVLTAEVERRAADIKRDAAASHAAVEESNFASESDGRQRAGLRFRLPMSAYPEFVERVRALGTVKDFSVQRNDRPARAADTADAPVVVDLLLYSEGRVVGEESGLGATLRRTFGQGAGALMWSVRMIGVAVAFFAPWAVLLAAGIGVVRWRRKKGRVASPRQS